MVKSLVELCTAVCIKNVRDIHDVGGAPYNILEPILLKIDSAAHLRELEVNSPHIQGDNAKCWIRLIKRDFPIEYQKEQMQPKNPESWHKVYARYKKMVEDRTREADEKLKNAYKKIEQRKASNVTQLVNYDRKMLGKPLRGSGSATNSNGLRFGAGSRTKMTSAQSIIMKARREAGEVAARNKLSTPTGQLLVQRGQITKAPLGMRIEYETKRLPGVRPPQQRERPEWAVQQKEREARLLKAKNGTATKNNNTKRDTTTKKTTYISDDELDTGDEKEPKRGGLNAHDLENLFDDDTKHTTTSATKPTTSNTKGPTSRTSKPAPMNPLTKMKMGQAWKDKAVTVVPAQPPTPKATSPQASSPPPRPHATPLNRPKQSSSPTSTTRPSTAAGSPGSEQPKTSPQPMMGQKRKRPSYPIMVQPKPKNRRIA